MEERQLHCFLAIAEFGSVTQAAAKLDMAQPSLSQMLLRLEDELGVKLFERTSRGVILTEAGQIFRKRADTILQEMAGAKEEIRFGDRLVSGNVSVGLPSSVSNLVGVRLLVEAKERYPGITINVAEAMSGHIRRWLEEKSLDVGILYNIPDKRLFTADQIAVEELFIVGPSGFFPPTDGEVIAPTPVPLSDLGKYSFILPTQQHGLRRFLDEKAKQYSLELNVTFELDSLAHIKTLVMRGHGFSLLSHAAIAEELKEGRCSAARISKPIFRRGIFMVRNPAHIVTRASVRISDLFAEIVTKLINEGDWIASRVAMADDRFQVEKLSSPIECEH